MSSETSRLGLATRHPWKLISSPPKRGMVGKARLTRSIATVKAVRSSKTRGSVCALPRGIVPHMIMAFQNTPVNLGQRRSHSQFFIFDLAQSLARSGDARRNFRTAQTSLAWICRSARFDPTNTCSSHLFKIATDRYPLARIRGNRSDGHGMFTKQPYLIPTQLLTNSHEPTPSNPLPRTDSHKTDSHKTDSHKTLI